MSEPRILLGTCSWSADGWKGVFYPRATPSSEYIREYSRHFRTVEIDATFYATPASRTVSQWAERTPPGFIFSSKAPRIVTHEKVLVDAGEDINQFCRAMEPLGSRLGPILLQFPYFSRNKGPGFEEFLDRLRLFLPQLPAEFQWALEIRNRSWLRSPLLDLLRSREVALALIDHPYMPGPDEIASPYEWVTAPFAYIRWLGDRYAIEEQTRTFDHTIIDRTKELTAWVGVCQSLLQRTDRVVAYANNHYAGHAPDTIRQFNEIWGGALLEEFPRSEYVAEDAAVSQTGNARAENSQRGGVGKGRVTGENPAQPSLFQDSGAA